MYSERLFPDFFSESVTEARNSNTVLFPGLAEKKKGNEFSSQLSDFVTEAQLVRAILVIKRID